jgi:hypothetical protein
LHRRAPLRQFYGRAISAGVVGSGALCGGTCLYQERQSRRGTDAHRRFCMAPSTPDCLLAHVEQIARRAKAAAGTERDVNAGGVEAAARPKIGLQLGSAPTKLDGWWLAWADRPRLVRIATRADGTAVATRHSSASCGR